MPINVNTSNYINTQTAGTGSGQNVSASVNVSTEGAVVSVKGLDLQTGQTLSGQVVDIDGKDIKLLLSNNQTISARLEGNINALLGQTLSFEVKSTEDGQTALRPLYTNLNNSQNVSNALNSAGLPVTENYAKMVSSMMDENMPINKQAIYDMSKQVNSFPNANPDTVVKLNKLGLQVNELTINQFENYKGLEYQIKGNVDTIAKGLSDLIEDSLSGTVKELGIEDISLEKQVGGVIEQQANIESGKSVGKNLLSAFLSAITGQENTTAQASSIVGNNTTENQNIDVVAENDAELTKEQGVSSETTLVNNTDKGIDTSVFDTTKQVLEMVEPSDSGDVSVTKDMKSFVLDFAKALDETLKQPESASVEQTEQHSKAGRTDLLNELAKNALKTETVANGIENSKSFSDILGTKDITGNSVLDFAKEALKTVTESGEDITPELKEKLAKLLSSKEFLGLVKDNISKQMLLKPEEVVSSKNVEELYSKITRQANQAMEILQAAGKDQPEMLEAAKNIRDNVTFMNELNQVVTYVQLPLLMNNKSAHGDLYVYTNKKSLKNNDGNISALLHLDMDNLGPMDIYVALTNGTKVNTHFYLKDEATIDFIEAHIDQLNKRLTDKGYNMSTNISVKDLSKGETKMADEFFKDDPSVHGGVATKFSFDVRA